MVEHGDIVKLRANSHFYYITVIHNEKYLLLALESLNRREEFVCSFDYAEHTHMNIKDLNLKGLIKSYIEDNELKTTKFEFYECGKIIKNKYTNQIYGCIVVDIGVNMANWVYYIIDLETFKLRPEISFKHIQENYEVYDDFNFHDLRLTLK